MPKKVISALLRERSNSSQTNRWSDQQHEPGREPWKRNLESNPRLVGSPESLRSIRVCDDVFLCSYFSCSFYIFNH